MKQVENDGEDLLGAWRQGRVARRDLYSAVRAVMYQGARQGIGFITASDPDDQAVEDVVYDAFLELERTDPMIVITVLGLAKRIAFRRGQDRGRKIIREREQLRGLLVDLIVTDDPQFREQDALDAAEQEHLVRLARGCMAGLTGEQRDIVEKTIMGRESLSDWALHAGKSHQSAGRQRARAVEALRRCMAIKNAGAAKEGSDERS